MEQPAAEFGENESLLELFRHPKYSEAEKNIQRWGGPLIFALGLLLYLYAQVGMSLIPILNRSAPVEADDAYTYILKAVEMESCFYQNCPALMELKPQLVAPTTEEMPRWLRYREYGRAFVIYTPLHSAFILAFHSAGFSWEASYNIVWICGSIFLGLVIAYFLYVLFGPGTAGVALALFSPLVLPSHGVLYIVPTNLALGIAMLMWALIIRYKDRAAWVMLAGILAMLAMHPVGRIYAVVTCFFYFIFASRPRSKRIWILCASVLALVAIAFLLPKIISSPVLSFKADPPPEDWTMWIGLSDTFKRVYGYVVEMWVMPFGGYISVAVLLLIGSLSISIERRKTLLIIGGPLAALLAASMMYLLPRYPAELFSRIWVAVVVILIGIIGQALITMMKYIYLSLRYIYHEIETRLHSASPTLSARGRVLAVGVVIISIIGINWTDSYISNTTQFRKGTMTQMESHNDLALDPSQPATAHSRLSANDSILYTNEILMHFFFSRGTLQFGAVYYPALKNTPDAKQWVEQNDKIKYIVAYNQIGRASFAAPGALSLDPGKKFKITTPPTDISSISFHFENPGEEASIAFCIMDEAQTENPAPVMLNLPAKSSGWQNISALGDPIVSSFYMVVTGTRNPVKLKGLRINGDVSLNWPWDRGVTLSTAPPHDKIEPEIVRFETTDLVPKFNRPLKVVADNGSAVLAEVLR